MHRRRAHQECMQLWCVPPPSCVCQSSVCTRLIDVFVMVMVMKMGGFVDLGTPVVVCVCACGLGTS